MTSAELPAALSPGLLRLAADFLDELSERMSCDGCNDWTPPEYLTPEMLADLAWYAWEANGCQPDERPEPVRSNFVAVGAVARKLRNEANRMEADHGS